MVSLFHYKILNFIIYSTSWLSSVLLVLYSHNFNEYTYSSNNFPRRLFVVEYGREKAKLLSETLLSFNDLVIKQYQTNNFLSDPDKLFRLKNLVEEYKLHLLGSEILRINQFSYEEKETDILVERVKKAVYNIDEYIENNLEGLFIFSAKLHSLKAICRMFPGIS